jgi:hypothetical protein
MKLRMLAALAASVGTLGTVAALTTPAASAAVAVRGTYTPVDPVRILDTRDGTGVAGQHPGPFGAGTVTELVVTGANGVPDTGVGAVTLNVTATQSQGPGYLTVFPCGEIRPAASNLNYEAGVDVPNLVTSKVGVDGKVCIYSHGTTQVLADLEGWYANDFAARPGARYTEMTPSRILDTRDGTGVAGQHAGPLGIGEVTKLQITGANGVPDDAVAVTMNVTVTEANGPGYVTVYPCGRPRPLVSNVNFVHGVDVANLVTVRIGDGGQVCFFASESTQVVADIQGYFGPRGGVFTAVSPERILDTRDGTGVDNQHRGPLGDGKVVVVQVAGQHGVPLDARAVALNLTITDAAGRGFATVYPCGQLLPITSSINFVTGVDVANLVKTKLSVDGKVCIYTHRQTQVVADLEGFFTAA